MTVPKNCGHCFFYNEDLHLCKYKNKPVGNINTCNDWTPLEMHFNNDNIKFTSYDQYKLKNIFEGN